MNEAKDKKKTKNNKTKLNNIENGKIYLNNGKAHAPIYVYWL